MTDIRLSAADAGIIAGLHKDAHDGIAEKGTDTPATVDAGSASDLVGMVISSLATEAADLATANLMVANIVNAIADEFYATDEDVEAALEELRGKI